MKRASCALGLVLLGVVCTTRVSATTFVPMSVDDLTRSSVATVIGTVADLAGSRSSDGRISTLVSVVVDQVLKGELTDSVITLKQPGGAVGDIQHVVFGAPRFRVGEHVVLFLTVGAGGSLRTNHMALGKFGVVTDADGIAQAVQDLGAGAAVLTRRGSPAYRQSLPLSELLGEVERAEPAAVPGASPGAGVPAGYAAFPTEVTAEFTLLGPGRFFEADEGQTLDFLIDENGDATLGLTASRQAVDDALAEWTDVGTATISLADGGLTSDLSEPCMGSPLGPHKIRFNDPDGDIDPPVSCAGVLALGGFCSTSSESKVFNGTTFERGLRGTVTFADGWGSCSTWTQCNVAEVATHEIGHAIGLGHSADTDSTMYPSAHFDGRCADVRTDDINGINFIYPTTIPPTITTASPLPDASLGVPYSQTLTATGGTGPYAWSQVGGGGFPGLSLSAGGVISGTPTATGNGIFFVKATDSAGDSHTKRFDIEVTSGPTRTPTATPTVTPTRTPTPLPTHDSVVEALKPLKVKIPFGALSITKTVKVKVVNADVEPSTHTIQLTAANGSCPAGIVSSLDLNAKFPGLQDTVELAGSKSAKAVVTLNIVADDFTSVNSKAPDRCRLTFTATTTVPALNTDPQTTNNTATLELNVTDENDADPLSPHEAVLTSIKPVKVSIKDGTTTVLKAVKAKVVNGDLGEDPGHTISLVVSATDCPGGTVGTPDFDPDTPAPDTSTTVKGGSSATALVPLTITSTGFATSTAKSPTRCTVDLTAGPGGDPVNTDNNATRLVIDVFDKNDF